MIDKFKEFISFSFRDVPTNFYRRTCIGIYPGNNPVCGDPGMEEGDEVVGGMAAGGVSVYAPLPDGLCPKHPGGMDL